MEEKGGGGALRRGTGPRYTRRPRQPRSCQLASRQHDSDQHEMRLFEFEQHSPCQYVSERLPSHQDEDIQISTRLNEYHQLGANHLPSSLHDESIKKDYPHRRGSSHQSLHAEAPSCLRTCHRPNRQKKPLICPKISWLPLLLLILLPAFVLADPPCPQDENLIAPCHCSTRADEIQIWCSQSDLSGVTAGLEAVSVHVGRPVDELILENNVLSSLPGQAFSALLPARIMLRSNHLERVSSNSFGGLEDSLVEVFIVEPELRSFPDDVLDSLRRLEAFTLQAGILNRLPSFANLSKLRYVHTQLPRLTELVPSKFRALDSLEQIHILESPLLTRLEAGLFHGLPRLTSLNLTDCGISWIHSRALSMLPSLKELTLSKNQLEDAGDVGQVLRELPVLTTLNLDHNFITVVRDGSFVDIPTLRELSLRSNRITEIYRGAFHRLPTLQKLDLSHNRIRRLHPEFFVNSFENNVEELHLVDNRLEHIMNLRIVLESFPRLKVLDAGGNILEEISYGTLRGHQTLERFHLDNNSLRRVVREAFNSMPALRELTLRNNSLSNYLEMPLWDLPALKGIDLSGNEFRLLDRRVVANLPSLRRLDMSTNHLMVVDPSSFLGSPGLETANLSNNALDKLDPMTFSHLSNMFELDVSCNQLTRVVPGLPRALEHLHMRNNRLAVLPRAPSPDLLLPSLRTLDVSGNRLHQLNSEGLISMPLLTKLYLSDNSLQSVEERAFEGLGRLEMLDLSQNRLLGVHSDCLRDLRRLRVLRLDGNRLELVEPTLLRENKALTSIHLSHNQLSHLSQDIFSNNKALRNVNLSHNTLSEFPRAVMSLPMLEHLDLGHNRIATVTDLLEPLTALRTLSFAKNKLTTLFEGTFSAMPNLTTLDLESNELQFVSPHVVRSMPALVNLHLSKNKLSTIPSAAFSDLPSLVKMELQENQLRELASDSFSGVPNILLLNLSYNQLTGLDHAGLHGLKSLEVLDLSHNKISNFDYHNFPPLDSLIQLRMDNNKLCNIRGSPFTKMSHLRMLSLRNNKLTSLSEQAFEPIRSTMYHLDVEGNPLRCSCGLLWLQAWLKATPHAGPRCSDGSLLKEFRLARDNCAEPKHYDVIPGCEQINQNEATEANNPASGTNWKELKEDKRPTPEESEYFYEEYIEYEDNSSLPAHVVSSSTAQTPVVLISASSTIPPGVLSHFIPGDTPTLYAGNSKPAQDEPKTQSGTTFTFFGMPLPSLNLGKFWGSGRNSDGGKAPKGRIQAVPPHPTPVMQKGFTPVLQTGGFRPIFDPYSNVSLVKPVSVHEHPWNTSYEHNTASSEEHNVTVRTQRRPQPNQTLDKQTKATPITYSIIPTRQDETTRTPDKTYDRPDRQMHDRTADRQMHARFPDKNNRHPDRHLLERPPQLYEQTPERKINDWPLDQLNHNTPTDRQIPKHMPDRNSNIIISDKSTEAPTSTSISSIIHSDPIPNINNHISSSATIEVEEVEIEKEDIPVNRGPASLSGFLAPGGQLPPYRTPGRPTITKVEGISGSTGPSGPVAEEIHGAGPRVQNSITNQSSRSYTTKAPTLVSEPTLGWYFENYNNTNLEPYIGPGTDLMGFKPSSANNLTPLLSLFITANIFYMFI